LNFIGSLKKETNFELIKEYRLPLTMQGINSGGKSQMSSSGHGGLYVSVCRMIADVP